MDLCIVWGGFRLRKALHLEVLFAPGAIIDQVRQRTKRTMPLPTQELIEELNALLRGWGEYYKRAHIRKLFQRLWRIVISPIHMACNIALHSFLYIIDFKRVLMASHRGNPVRRYLGRIRRLRGRHPSRKPFFETARLVAMAVEKWTH